MGKHLSHRPLKSNSRLGKRWERKQEEKEYVERDSFFRYKEPRKVELLEVFRQGNHRLQLITRNTCKIYINQEGFKMRIEPEGKMSVSRVNTPIGAEYDISFAGDEEWSYIKSAFMALAFMASK